MSAGRHAVNPETLVSAKPWIDFSMPPSDLIRTAKLHGNSPRILSRNSLPKRLVTVCENTEMWCSTRCMYAVAVSALNVSCPNDWLLTIARPAVAAGRMRALGRPKKDQDQDGIGLCLF